MDPIVQTDSQGVPRYLSFPSGAPVEGLGSLAPQAQADQFLERNAALLALPAATLKSLAVPIAALPEAELNALRAEVQKRVMDSLVLGYAQTYFGLPVIGAGVSVTLRDEPRAVLAATSTVHHDIQVARPSDEDIKRASVWLQREQGAGMQLAEAGLTDPQDGLEPAQRNTRINSARLVILRFDAQQREGGHGQVPAPAGEPVGLQEAPLPSLPLPPLPDSIRDGAFYVALELCFTATTALWGRLNWRMHMDVSTLAILRLEPLVDHANAAVFLRDPITKGSGLAPSATSVQLNPLRDSVTLAGLAAPSGGTQALSGEFVTVIDAVTPTVSVPTTGAPYNFSYDTRSNNFAAANTYFQCDRFFRMVRDIGFDVPSYFDGTSFPVGADHRGFGGNVINARCPGNAAGNGIGTVEFALADLSDTANPIGIAADWRVVLHELGGHGILWDHVNSPNFGFAHSAGDSFAAILGDPGSAAPDRFVTFPWVSIGRRHDRTLASGWGWGGSNDVGGYSSEQVLCSTLFRLYRSIGGDSASVPRREFAARTAAYLILRAVGQLTPGTNPGNALGFELQLETADAGVWTSTHPAETHAGGAYWKVIRWAFEKQGLFKAPGAPSTAEGAPPPVDVYIDDGRHGEYSFQPVHWGCTDIWSRRSIGDGGGVHEEPVVGATNYAYVRIKNRGTQAATGITVKGFHCQPGIGLTYPDDWEPMTTSQLPAPNLAAGDATGVVLGPFEWTPSQVGHECMFFSVSASADPSNIEGRITGSIPEWRLVPHDNNIGQRNVHPVAMSLTRLDLARRVFWLRNPFDRQAKMKLSAQLPKLLLERGWRLDFVSAGGPGFGMAAGARKEIVFAMAAGQPFDRAALPRAESERTILISAEADGIPLGGMSYVLDPDYTDPNHPGHPPGGSGEPATPAPCAHDASELLKCLKLDRAEIECVEVRKVSVDISFKGKCC
jgi:zinc metalloprotease ZmpB